ESPQRGHGPVAAVAGLRADQRQETLMPGPLNYTTKIPVNRTVTECQSLLAAAGASSASVEFEDGKPVGLSFTLKTPHGPRYFSLPVDVAAMHAVLLKAERGGQFTSAKKGAYTTREHAARVAWRVIKDWLEVVVALVAAKMATIDEVLLPYLVLDLKDGRKPLWQHYRDQEQAV